MRAISSMATRHVLADFTDAAHAAGFPPLEIESTGGVDAARRVAEGEVWDLVFLADDALTKLGKDGHVVGASHTPLLVSKVAVAVPMGDPREELMVRSADDVRLLLHGSPRIGYSTGPSGAALLQLIRDWELHTELGERLVQAPAGVPVAQLIRDREVDLGFQQLSELADVSGVHVLGTLPSECAIETTFSGAVSARSDSREAAWAMLSYFASSAVATIRAHHHFAPAFRNSDVRNKKRSP